MLVQRITQIVTGALFTLLVAFSVDSFAQDATQVVPPSQRYQPTQAQAAPPSVHITPENVNRLSGSTTLRRNLSDQSLAQWNGQSGKVAQTSYQEAATDEPAVPSILAGTPAMPQQQFTNPPSERRNISAARAASQSSVERFAPQVNQMKYDGPQVSPVMESGFRIPQKSAATASVDSPMERPEVGKFESNVRAFATRPTTPQPTTPQPTTPQPTTPRPAVETATPIASSQPEIRSAFPVKQAAAIQSASPRIKPIQRSIDRNVRPASRVVETKSGPKAALSLNAPGIEVETFGPQSIGVNKPASFRVEVTNTTSTDASDLLVGINLPEWVDVQNTNLSAGRKDITGGQQQARIMWTIDRVPAGKKQTATIVTIPRKAQPFDLSVEWTLVPRAGSVNITVTEPRLEMNMSGPSEVQFGETAVYTVTVRNPGTGNAENVVVMLPEEFGGDRANIGSIPAGKESTFDIELAARTAGQLKLTSSAAADGNLSTTASQDVVVRRAVLGVTIEGPPLKYAGTMARYRVTVQNTGDAPGNRLETAVAFPKGAKYLGGIDGAKESDGGILWQIGTLNPNQSKTYEIDCELDGSGDIQFEAGVRHREDPTKVATAAAACITTVETIADLVLTVQDPKGPLPTGEETEYQITVVNRGSKSARSVELLMQFSEGIEPAKAAGLQNRVVPGQVIFAPISQIDPGQKMTFQVTAVANKRGTHVFRAFLSCEDSDSREVAEGTTKFFGDEFNIEAPRATATANQAAGSNDFKR